MAVEPDAGDLADIGERYARRQRSFSDRK